MSEFRDSAPSASAVFYRSYSRRRPDGRRESFSEAVTRTVTDLAQIGGLSQEQFNLCLDMALNQHTLPSGRAMWVAGTEWSKKPQNFPGYYNCCSLQVGDPSIFGLLMELAMMGVGTGAVLEQHVVDKLPIVTASINVVNVFENPGKSGGQELTTLTLERDDADEAALRLTVGDSREGWASAYQYLIQLAYRNLYDPDLFSKEVYDFASASNKLDVILDLTQVRQAGERLKGFGGVANPVRLRASLENAAKLLSKARGRRLAPIECCLLIDEAASAVVAGNVRRSAGMKQFSSDDVEAASAKEGLYRQSEDGSWSVDPEREALRMSNHTLCFHRKPTLDEVTASVTKQFYSGEGAIQYVPEAIARANADLLTTPRLKQRFLDTYVTAGPYLARELLCDLAMAAGLPSDERILDHRISRYGLNPCGEILIRDNLCNLAEVNVNTIDPSNVSLQRRAFYAAGLQVASLLQHKFVPEPLAYSRRVDPIVGVGLTGGFDFMVHALGADWLEWMMRGRPTGARYRRYTDVERDFLVAWRNYAEAGVKDYCREHGIEAPNRFTDLQPSGSKSLLTGASPGWHPPKAQRFIRRITFGRNDPLVAALRDYGYSVIPAQSARDESGNLLDDIADPRVTEVLVEIPTEVSWANLPGCDQHDLSRLPVEAQWGFYMQFQNHYTTHNTSATIEFRQDEIPALSRLIYDNIQADGGYISAALLARFDANETFPRLPFEPISKQTYDSMMLQIKAYRSTLAPGTTVLDLLEQYDHPDHILAPQDSACASAACIARADKDESLGIGA
jgi:ribonucleotide reductase class II